MGISLKLDHQDTYSNRSEETRGYREGGITGREVLGVPEEMKGHRILRV